MKLTRLELSGFKSFADKVHLTFEDGITSIVGPNGCGKSNISDAVRWVLGEQRARVLRGSRMEDIIFQGAAKRRPLNVAQISLYFDNSDGTLPISYREVVVTRRLSRNGHSEYLLNQQPVRLRDVQDLLRGTGLGSDAGVVMEAGQIDRLLSDRTEDRRALFEEAAGIGLYRDRKTTTERRLEATKQDLQRLDDLVSEVQTQVRSLARQRGKAERHHKLTAERFGIVMTLARHTLDEFDREETSLRQRRDEMGESLPHSREVLAERERERENLIQARATAEAQRTDGERRLADQRLEVGRLEGDLKLAGERLKNATDRKERALEELSQADARASQAMRERDAAAQERKAAAEARQSVQTELDLRASDENQARDRLTGQRDAVRKLESSLQEQAETLRALAGEQDALERDLEVLRSQSNDAEQRREEAARAHQDLVIGLRAAEEELANRQRVDKEASSDVERARHTLLAAKEHEAALLVERRSADENRAQLKARREALEALERDRAGLAPAARKLLAHQDEFGEHAVLGPLSDYLRPPAGDAEVAERLLSDWLNAVLVSDEETVARVRQWHAEQKPGPLLLLPLDPGPTDLGRGTDGNPRFEVADPAQAWARALLADATAMDESGHAIRRANGAVFLAGSEEAGGPLSRRADLERLGGELDHAEREVARLEQGTAEAAHGIGTAEHDLAKAVRSADDSRQALHETRGAHGDAEREMQRVKRELSEASDAHSRTQQHLSERSARLEVVRRELRTLHSTRAQAEAELDQQRSFLKSLETEQETARENRVHWQVEEAQVSVREEAAGQREARAEKSLHTAQEEKESLRHEIADIVESTSGSEADRARWTDQLAERNAEVAELETTASEAEQAVIAAEHATTAGDETVAQARNTVQELGEELHRIELVQTEITGRRTALVQRIEAEWRRPLADLLEDAPEVEGDEDAMREEAERIAEKLQTAGPVNPLAEQEHEEESKRLEFLETQRSDLVDARASLLQALKEIDDTARAMFTETFDAIRENFKTVFLILFEVGECDVRLVDENDPLNSEIEIRAAPRGKRTQRIHLLSSGERALVAISLLFAIYLIKPSPFCLLDEVDAPLDDANVQRFLRLLTEFKANTQFIVITHNPRTMQTADAVYGVTMQEPGVSSIVGVRLGERAAIA